MAANVQVGDIFFAKITNFAGQMTYGDILTLPASDFDINLSAETSDDPDGMTKDELPAGTYQWLGSSFLCPAQEWGDISEYSACVKRIS